MAKKFVDNLKKVTKEGQYIFYASAPGYIGMALDGSSKIKKVENNIHYGIYLVH